MAAVAAAFAGGYFAVTMLVATEGDAICRQPAARVLARPYKLWKGNAYYTRPLDVQYGNDNTDGSRSKMVLCEDDRQVGPAHPPLQHVVDVGNGSYTHWGSDVFFSATDNTDPNMNGRKYSFVELEIVQK